MPPEKELTTDNAIHALQGSMLFQVYKKRKPHKYRIMIFELYEARKKLCIILQYMLAHTPC
jgi:hypothetical protein